MRAVYVAKYSRKKDFFLEKLHDNYTSIASDNIARKRIWSKISKNRWISYYTIYMSSIFSSFFRTKEEMNGIPLDRYIFAL